MSEEVAKLEVKLHRAQAALDEQKKRSDAMAADLARVRDANRRGDVAYRKLAAVVEKSKELQHLSSVMEEKETFAQQAKMLQELLRQNATELEKYKKIAEGVAPAQSISAADGARDKTVELEELRQKMEGLQRTLKSLEDAKAADSAAGVGSDTAGSEGAAGGAGGAGSADGDAEGSAAAEDDTSTGSKDKTHPLDVDIQRARDELQSVEESVRELEEELEGASSAAIKAARAREKLEREARAKEQATNRAIAEKDKTIFALREKVESLETSHAKDLQNVFLKLKEKETELESCKRELSTTSETNAQIRQRLDEIGKKHAEEMKTMRKSLSEEIKAAREGRGYSEDPKKVEQRQAALKQLTAAAAEADAARIAAEEKAKELRERAISKDKRIQTAILEKAEAQSQLKEITAELEEVKERLQAAEAEESRLQTSLDDTKAKLDEAEIRVAVLEEEIEPLRELKSETPALREKCTALESQLAEATKSAAEAGARASSAEAQVEELTTAIDDAKAEHKIATRMLKQLNKDLKAQLAKERTKVGQLEAAASKGGLTVRADMGALETPTRLGSPSHGARSGPGPSTPTSGMSVRTPGHRSAGSSPAQGPVAAGAAPPPLPAPSGDSETVRLLSQRLQAVLGEKEAAQEKIRFLEGIVQELTKDLDTHKAMVQQLTTSKGVGDATDAVSRVVQSAMTSDNPLRVLQGLLTKALSDNERLKRDMKILGEELSRANGVPVSDK